jgi:hypothetical protein
MYAYIHIHTRVIICVFIYIYVYIYVYTYLYMNIYTYIHTCLYLYIYRDKFTYIYLYIKLQMRLLVLCRRSLAYSVGRGALTLGSLTPLMAEALPCPPLSLSGRIPPNNSPLLLDTVTAPEELTLWPEFHNGVAAGLRVNPPLYARNDSASNSSGRVHR